MDDDLQQLEAELTSLRPRPPSRALVTRIERELATVRRRPAPLFWFWIGALPAAAALALGVGTVMRRGFARPVPATAAAGAENPEFLKPVAAENVLYSDSDEGVVTLEDGTRARRERLNYVDIITWKNPKTNASLKWTIPREEVRVVPVVFQ